MYVIIDCNYICHRARYSTGPLEYKGKPTGVVFGFFNQLFTILKNTYKMKPANSEPEFIFAWDSKQSLRKQHYPFYKEKSKKNDEDLEELQKAFQQFDELYHDILPTIGIHNNFAFKGFEGDDIIGRICKEEYMKKICNEHPFASPIFIVTADDDILQLLSDDISIYNLGKDKLHTQQDFMDEYYLFPKQWVSVKKIAGCDGDNVPGVPGVAVKTAIKYIKGQLNPNTKKYQAIKQNNHIIKRNGWLVRLPLPETPTIEITKNTFALEEFKKICKEYGFQKWLEKSNIIDDFNLYLI